MEIKTVLFYDFTKNGELATSLRELMRGMERTLGFGIKVVERTGPTLRSQFPLGSLWEGTGCERIDCITCTQGAEMIPNCTKSSILYENVCLTCNPGAKERRPLVEVRNDVPSLYIGESSRSIYERSREHWADWRGKKGSSHIMKHQEQAHSLEEEPRFIMRVVRSYRTALSRQIGEAVRIRRRGGEGGILNSKAEYSRCRITRLVLDDQKDEELDRMEEEELIRKREQLEADLLAWSSIKFYAREQQMSETRRQLSRIDKRIKACKREQIEMEEGAKPKRRRKMNHPVLDERWGEEVGGPPTQPSQAGGGREAQTVIREQGALSTRRMRQPLIYQMFSTPERSTLSLADRQIKQGSSQPTHQLKSLGGGTVPSPEDRMLVGAPPRLPSGRSGAGLARGRVGAGGPPSPPQTVEAVDTVDTVDAVDTVGTVDTGQGTPSLADRQTVESKTCQFLRGFCMQHNVKGVRYIVTSKKWRDRGKGKGFGYVTSKLVRYRCGEVQSPESYSNPGKYEVK